MSNIAKRKKRGSNGKGRTSVAVAMPEDLQLLLDTANALDPGAVDPRATETGSLGICCAVVFRCVHSGGTPGLVMNFERYIEHRRICRIAHVSTSLKDLPAATPPRIILPDDFRQ